MGNVTINIANGQLGRTLQTADGVVGIVICGAVSPGGSYVGTPITITSETDLTSYAMTAVSEPFVYKTVQEFYRTAGVGAELHLLIYPETVTMQEVLDTSGTFTAQPLLDHTNGQIRLLGVCRNPTSETSVAGDFVMEDVMNALAVAPSFVENNQRANKPLRVILEGRIDNDTATPQDLTTLTNRYTMVMIGSLTQNDNHAAIGLALGRLVTIPVQRKISRVKDGTLPITEAWIKSVSIDSVVNFDAYTTKGYCVLRTYVGRTGYYFSGDPTAITTADDYAILCNGRVIDKAHRIAYDVYLNELDDEILITDDGQIDPGVAKFLEGKIESQVNGLMSGEISRFEAFVDPNQNVLSLSKVEVQAKIVPVGYSSDIEITLGFDNPF